MLKYSSNMKGFHGVAKLYSYMKMTALDLV